MTAVLFSFLILFVLLMSFLQFFKIEEKINNRFVICKTQFKSNIAFELVKESKLIHGLQRIFGGANEIKIGDDYFDSKIFISSDFQIIKKVLSNAEVKEIVEFIVTYPKVKGIFFKNKSVHVLFSGNKNTKIEEIERVERLSSLVADLIKKEYVNERAQAKDFAFKIEEFLESSKNFYFSLLISSLLTFIFIMSFYNDRFIYISGVDIKPVLFLSLIIFGLVNFFIWYKTVGSIRTHNIYLINLFMFLPACFMTAFIMSHTLNIILDKSEIEYSVSSYNTSIERGSKNSKRYYMFIKVDPDSSLPKDGFLKSNMTYKIKISSSMYYKLSQPKAEKIEIYTRTGAFNYPYIIDIAKK